MPRPRIRTSVCPVLHRWDKAEVTDALGEEDLFNKVRQETAEFGWKTCDIVLIWFCEAEHPEREAVDQRAAYHQVVAGRLSTIDTEEKGGHTSILRQRLFLLGDREGIGERFGSCLSIYDRLSFVTRVDDGIQTRFLQDCCSS
jgi:hypothetical protein